jgi:hypothetical protein
MIRQRTLHRSGPVRRLGRLRRHLTSATLGLVAVLGVACGGADDPTTAATGAPRPLSDAAPTRRDAPTSSSVVTPSTTLEPTTTMPGARAADDDAWRIADEVLARYGAVLDQLSAEPTGAPAPGTPARARWDEVVAPSALSDDVLGRLHRRAIDERVVVVPGPQGVAYRHRATSITSATDARIDFEWCGWSPGIGRSIDTGEVVDDQVAHATGTGHLEHDGVRWRLAALDQLDLVLLAPGAEDPCPTPMATPTTAPLPADAGGRP